MACLFIIKIWPNIFNTNILRTKINWLCKTTKIIIIRNKDIATVKFETSITAFKLNYQHNSILWDWGTTFGLLSWLIKFAMVILQFHVLVFFLDLSFLVCSDWFLCLQCRKFWQTSVWWDFFWLGWRNGWLYLTVFLWHGYEIISTSMFSLPVDITWLVSDDSMVITLLQMVTSLIRNSVGS